jgi:hypothetical protein
MNTSALSVALKGQMDWWENCEELEEITSDFLLKDPCGCQGGVASGVFL